MGFEHIMGKQLKRIKSINLSKYVDDRDRNKITKISK